MASLARLVATVGVEVEEGGTKRGRESGGDEPEEQEGGGGAEGRQVDRQGAARSGRGREARTTPPTSARVDCFQPPWIPPRRPLTPLTAAAALTRGSVTDAQRQK